MIKKLIISINYYFTIIGMNNSEHLQNRSLVHIYYYANLLQPTHM